MSMPSPFSPLLSSRIRAPTQAWNDDRDRKSTRLNSSHTVISYAVFCLKKKKTKQITSAGFVSGGVYVVATIPARWAHGVGLRDRSTHKTDQNITRLVSSIM